jgi:DNA repair protein SbcD/Mre11
MLDSPPRSGGCDVRVLFVSDTHMVSIGRHGRASSDIAAEMTSFRISSAPWSRHAPVKSMSSCTAATCCTESRVPAWLTETALAPLKRLASSGVPVLLVPGNHERGRIPYPLLAVHDGLHVFDRPRSVVLHAGGVRVAFIGLPYTHDIRRRFPAMLAAASRENTTADVRVLCVHHCVEGATCGPGNFTFRFGADIIRTADLPGEVAVTLSGHIHCHQVLRPAGRPPVIYAGSVERTSFAEAPETKGFVVLRLTQSGLGPFEFRPLPARPMVARTVHFDDADAMGGHLRVAAAIDSTPHDAVVHLRVTGTMPATLTAAALRAMAGARTVTLAVPAADRRVDRQSQTAAGIVISPS